MNGATLPPRRCFRSRIRITAIPEVEFGIPLPDWLILRTHSVEITQMGQGDRQMRIADATRQNRESASHLRLRRISLSPYLLPKLHVITPYLGRTCVRPNPTSRARSPSGAGPSARTQNIPLRGGGKRPAGNMPTLQANDVVRRTTPKGHCVRVCFSHGMKSKQILIPVGICASAPTFARRARAWCGIHLKTRVQQV